MTIQIETLSTSELKTLSVSVADELKTREGAALADARARVLAIAKEAGFSVQELTGGNVKAAKAILPIKYRNPNDAKQSWTGRGRQPGWFRELAAAGKGALLAA